MIFKSPDPSPLRAVDHVSVCLTKINISDGWSKADCPTERYLPMQKSLNAKVTKLSKSFYLKPDVNELWHQVAMFLSKLKTSRLSVQKCLQSSRVNSLGKMERNMRNSSNI
jgi:hypothetical protein